MTFNTASLLPLIPRIFFVYVEPVLMYVWHTYLRSLPPLLLFFTGLSRHLTQLIIIRVLATTTNNTSHHNANSITGMTMQYTTTHELLSSSSLSISIQALAAPALSATYLFAMMLYGLAILLVTPPNKRLLQLHIGILILSDFTHWGMLFWTMAKASGDEAGMSFFFFFFFSFLRLLIPPTHALIQSHTLSVRVAVLVIFY